MHILHLRGARQHLPSPCASSVMEICCLEGKAITADEGRDEKGGCVNVSMETCCFMDKVQCPPTMNMNECDCDTCAGATQIAVAVERQSTRRCATFEYTQKADGTVEPLNIHSAVFSTQHAWPSKAVRSKVYASYTGKERTAPSREEMDNSSSRR